MAADRRPLLALLCTLTVLAGLVPRAHAQALLDAHYDAVLTPAGLGPWNFFSAAGDLDGDQVDDLVFVCDTDAFQYPRLAARLGSANGLGPVVANVLLGEFDASFGFVAVGPLDAGPTVDVVVSGTDSIYVLLGVGNGQLGAPVRLPAVGCGTSPIAIGRFDADAHTDLAVGLAARDSVQVFLGDGAGGFVAGVRVAAPDQLSRCTAADFNEDGIDDVLVGGVSSSSLLLADGAGGFTPMSIAEPGAFPAGRLDDAGHVDLMSAAGARLGNGDGTFGPAIPHGVANLSFLADFDEDGNLDLVSTFRSPAPAFNEYIAIRLGDGAGAFGPEVDYIRFFDPGDISRGDFNGDGHVDIANVALRRSMQFLHRGVGDGTLVRAIQHGLPAAASEGVVGDVDGNGSADLVTIFRPATSVGVSLQTTGYQYTLPLFVPTPAGPGQVRCTDLDGDGRDDVLVLCDSADSLAVWLAQPGGVLGSRTTFAIGASALMFEVADLDGNGTKDVVTNGLENEARVLPGLGGGTFGAALPIPVRIASDLAVRDLNGDGLLDIVTGNPTSALRIVLATAPLTYPAAVDYAGPATSLTHLAVGRFDADTVADVVTRHTGTGAAMQFYRGLGGGVFAARVSLALTGAGTLEAADLDDDGMDDLLILATSIVQVARGNAAGTFAPVEGYGVASGPTRMTIGDVDDDGDVDAVTFDGGDPQASILLNLTIDPTVGVPPRGPAPARLALRPLANPVRGDLMLALDVPGRGTVTVELLDLAGRRVAERRWDGLEPGPHTLRFGSLAHRPTGILFVRARQGDREGSARIAVLH